MTDKEQQPKKRVKRSDEEETAKTGLHLKSLFSKKPWYFGGKVLVSRDASTAFCAHQGGLAVVKDFSTITKILAEGDDVVSFAMASGPETIALCTRRGLIRVYKQDLEELRSFNSMHSGPVSEMDLDPTGECLATGSTDFSIRVFSTSGGYATHNFRGHRGIISAVKFHPNEGNLILATADVVGGVSLWDLRSKKNTWFRNHMGCVPSVAFLGQNLLVSVGRDRVLSVWSKDKPDSPLKTVPTFESMETVVALEGNQFVTGGASGALKKWKFDQKKNECIAIDTIEGAVGGDAIFQLNLLRLGNSKEQSLVAISQSECIFSFRAVKDIAKETRPQVIGFDDEIYDVCFLNERSWASMAVATNSAIVRVYSFTPEGLPESVRLLVGHESSVLSIASSQDFLVTGSKDQTAKIWSTSSFDCIGTCEGHTDAVSTVATCSKSTHKLFATGSDDCSIRLWSLDDEKTVTPLDQRVAHTKPLLDVCFSPNDEILASASADKTCKLWTVEPLKKGKYKLTGPTVELKGHRRAVNSVRFSSMDRVVCTASADTTVRVWSIVTGACVRTLQSHASPVTCALFMSNGTSLVSSGADGSIKAWDLKASACVQTLFGSSDGGHDDRIWALGLVKTEEDEQFVTSVGVNGVITVWRDATQEEKEKRLEMEKAEILSKEALDRSIREKRYLDAAKLALKLDRPHQLRQILEMIPHNESTQFIRNVLEGAEPTRVTAFLTAVASWNTLGRSSLVAQRAIAACVDLGPKLEVWVGKPTVTKFLNSVMPYTQRHFARIDRVLKSSYLLDRALESSSVV